MKLSLQSQLTLFPLLIRKDRKHYIVEDASTGEFFEMPKICIDAIEFIQKGKSLEWIEGVLKEHYPGEEVDLLGFAVQLMELQLVEKIDGEALGTVKRKKDEKGFVWIPASVGQFFFNKVTKKLFGLLFFLNILIFFVQPEFIPHYQDIFLFETMMLSILTWMGVSFLLVLFHELGHILAVRSHQLPAKLGIGHRLFFVVFETDMTPAWRLTPKERNSLYTAGMAFDQLLLFLVLVVQMLFSLEHPLLLSLLALIVLDIFIRTVYQCCFYMKTDLYYLFENMTGCYNVMENAKANARNWLPFAKKQGVVDAFEGEKRIVQLFGIFYVSGIVVTVGMFLFYFFPQAFYAFMRTLPALKEPINTVPFWDAFVFIGQTFLFTGLLCYSWIKNRTRVA